MTFSCIKKQKSWGRYAVDCTYKTSIESQWGPKTKECLQPSQDEAILGPTLVCQNTEKYRYLSMVSIAQMYYCLQRQRIIFKTNYEICGSEDEIVS